MQPPSVPADSSLSASPDAPPFSLGQEEYEAKLRWLQQAIAEADTSIDHGEGIELNSPEEIEAFLRTLRSDVAREPASTTHA